MNDKLRNPYYLIVKKIAEMASYSKVVTGLTGMNVAKNPTHTLGVLYRSGLALLLVLPRGLIYISART